MPHADVHVLGSKQGYTTLAAGARVSAGERSELEVLSFGDLASAEAIAGLAVRPVVTGRRLRSGRFAISRMLPGLADDVGRPTIEVVSLLLAPQAYAEVVRGLGAVARDVGFWQATRDRAEAGVDVRVADALRSADDPAVLRAFDLWAAARSRGAAGVLPESDSDAVLSMVGRLARADLESCRWGIGISSLTAPVDVFSGAPALGAHEGRRVLRPRADGGWHCAGMASAVESIGASDTLPRASSVVATVAVGGPGEPVGLDLSVAGEEDEVVGRASTHARRSRRVLVAGACAAATWTLFAGLLLVYLTPGGKQPASAVGIDDPTRLSTQPTGERAQEPAERPNAEIEGYARSESIEPRVVDSEGEPVAVPDEPAAIATPPIEVVRDQPSEPTHPTSDGSAAPIGAESGPQPPVVAEPARAPASEENLPGPAQPNSVPVPAHRDTSPAIEDAKAAIEKARKQIEGILDNLKSRRGFDDPKDLEVFIGDQAMASIQAIRPVVEAHFRLHDAARKAAAESPDSPDVWPRGGFFLVVGFGKNSNAAEAPPTRPDKPPLVELDLASSWRGLAESIQSMKDELLDEMPNRWYGLFRARSRQGQSHVPIDDDVADRVYQAKRMIDRRWEGQLPRTVSEERKSSEVDQTIRVVLFLDKKLEGELGRLNKLEPDTP